jgi:hypothetical protein
VGLNFRTLSRRKDAIDAFLRHPSRTSSSARLSLSRTLVSMHPSRCLIAHKIPAHAKQWNRARSFRIMHESHWRCDHNGTASGAYDSQEKAIANATVHWPRAFRGSSAALIPRNLATIPARHVLSSMHPCGLVLAFR